MKGVFDLALLVSVAWAAWNRTPLSDLSAAAQALADGRELPDLLAHFRTAPPPSFQAELDLALQPPPPAPLGREPTPTPALQVAVSLHLGSAAWQTLAADLLAPAADPEAVLEAAAIGTDSRDRAIRRARSAGEPTPERYQSHRRFLSHGEQRRADHDVSDLLTLALVLDLQWPVDPELRVTSGFGPRLHPTLGVRRNHEGVDIAVPEGTVVNAAGDGDMRRGEDTINGRYTSIDHGNGVVSSYCHGRDWVAAEGEAVRRGDAVMESGNTGRSTGPHLHFGVRVGGRAIDPAPFRARGLATAPPKDQG